MRLLVLTGFFGSGKTTFLLRALRLATREARLKTLLVQNEIGRVGVDPEVFRRDDLVMQELLGGCICCSLSARLASVLLTLASEKNTDLACIEASGIATPGMVRRMLSGTDLESLPLLQINFLDAARLDRIEKMLDLPIIRQGIEEADLCVVNKIATAPDGFRESFEKRARKIRPDALLHFTNLSASELLPAPLAADLRQFFAGSPLRELASAGRNIPENARKCTLTPSLAAGHDHHGDPGVCSREATLAAPVRISSGTIRAAFDRLTGGIEAAGGLIGHVKVALIEQDGARHFLNATGGGRSEGAAAPDELAISRVVINAIAWRIELPALELLTTEFLSIFHE